MTFTFRYIKQKENFPCQINFLPRKIIYADLEKIIIATIGISENKEMMPTPTNLREVLMYEKEIRLVKFFFLVINIINIV